MSTIDDPTTRPRPNLALGVLPFIGVILFVATSAPILLGDRTGNWQRDLVQNGVVYMIGWAGIGAGISHLAFGKKISASIGWAPSPFELEVGFANLGMGIAGVMSGGQPASFWLAVIVVNSIFRVGCGFGHVRQIVANRDFAPNNTAILFLNFVVPAFLLLSYAAWI